MHGEAAVRGAVERAGLVVGEQDDVAGVDAGVDRALHVEVHRRERREHRAELVVDAGVAALLVTVDVHAVRLHLVRGGRDEHAVGDVLVVIALGWRVVTVVAAAATAARGGNKAADRNQRVGAKTD